MVNEERPSYQEGDRVFLMSPVRNDAGKLFPPGLEGTIVGVWSGGAAYEVEFPQGESWHASSPENSLCTVRHDQIGAVSCGVPSVGTPMPQP